jgi:hypothetical protein
MGLFGNKLLLKVTASSFPSGQFEIQVEKADNKVRNLLPLSCVSLIASQLTILSSRHPRSLSKRVLEFIEDPKSRFEATSSISGFKLQIFEGRRHNIHNKFELLYAGSPLDLDDDPVQTDIEHILMNYLTLVFNQLGNKDRINFRGFLLQMITDYQHLYVQVINQENIRDAKHRKALARKYVDFITTLYRMWYNPSGNAPGGEFWVDNLNEKKEFDSYLE